MQDNEFAKLLYTVYRTSETEIRKWSGKTTFRRFGKTASDGVTSRRLFHKRLPVTGNARSCTVKSHVESETELDNAQCLNTSAN